MDLPNSTQRLLSWVEERGHKIVPQQFPQGTKTAQDAAAAIGCAVAAIVKSLVFVVDQEVVVALIPGDLRLDPQLLANVCEAEHCQRASLEQAKEATGFSVGGTPPFGHRQSLAVFADRQLQRNDPVWAAAGTPDTVFPISIALLGELSSSRWVDISQAP